MIIVRFNADGSRTTIDDRTLADAVAGNLARIDREYEARLSVGIVWNGKPLEIDEASQGRMGDMVNRARSRVGLPADFAWRMADNSMMPMTATDLENMAIAASDRVIALRRARWAARDAVRRATTREAADGVQASWPN
jgi:hypothetical protein